MSAPTDAAGKELRKTIKSMLMRNHKKQSFLPADQAEKLTTRQMVVTELRRVYSNERDIQWLADYVVAESTKATALYLLMAHIKNLDALLDLATHGYGDADLPAYPAGNSLRSVNWTSKSGKPEFWPVLDKWDLDDIDMFGLRQWTFLAPVFSPEKFHHELEDDTCLPFIIHHSHRDRGHYSSVYEVAIHKAHQTVFPSGGSEIAFKAALKEIQKGAEAFAQEKEFLDIVRLVEHHHLIRPLASFTYRQSDDRGSFLFPWADGGNLAQAWRGEKLRDGAARRSNRHLADWALTQIHGLCGALRALHSKEGRHGDIKPENILLFHDSASTPGTLKIADFGLGRFHANVTSERKRREQKTRTNTATSRYAPPEFVLNIGGQLPRSQDVWSLGCVFLEFVTWAASGIKGLDELSRGGMHHFWQDNGPKQPRSLHKAAKAVVDDLKEILSGDNLSPAALYDVLDLVETRMLVVDQERWRGDQLMKRLDEIYDRAMADQEYLLDMSLGSRLDTHRTANSAPVSRDIADDASVKALSMGVPEIWISDETGQSLASHALESPARGVSPTKKNYVSQFGQVDNDRWTSKADNTFLQDLFQKAGWPRPLSSELSQANNFCDRCAAMDILAEELQLVVRNKELTESSRHCRLCKLLTVAFKHTGNPEDEQLRITRVGSSLVVGAADTPILSIYVDPEHVSQGNGDVQIGTPLLPEPASKHQFELMKAWINNCVTTHAHTGAKAVLSVEDRPSRVIDVGSTAQPLLRLLDGKDMVTQEYIALSHCWGPRKDLHFGKTVSENYVARQTAIDPDELPLNFQDAIEVARGLGVRYLWIDSICIIQHDKEDWKRESVRMEQVYSNSKCVLAASSAALTTDGFLRHTRKARNFVTLTSSSGVKSYVCENIDNFKQDVEESVLNTRGWVLQERALARRTIHFAAAQTYFECGEGQCCESLMKLSNAKSATLGDSDFPKSAEKFFRGERIMLIQDLYELYSNLHFNNPTDRPIGISGLEKRLASAFQTRGGYGVFEKYLERNLLWKASVNGGLKPIDFSEVRNVPSWSWMAYSGAISYIHIDFAKVEWTHEVKSPFDTSSGENGKQYWEANGNHAPPVLVLSKVRKLAATLQPVDLGRKITFDRQGTINDKVDYLRCVVLGKHQPGSDLGSPSCYVLIIKQIKESNACGQVIYERLGAGELGENLIGFDSHESGEMR